MAQFETCVLTCSESNVLGNKHFKGKNAKERENIKPNARFCENKRTSNIQWWACAAPFRRKSAGDTTFLMRGSQLVD